MKHTILFLAANPLGTDRLELDREARAIQVELERSGFRDRFELVTRWAVEPLDLLREMRKLRPTIVHFSGHGDPGAVATARWAEAAADRAGGAGHRGGAAAHREGGAGHRGGAAAHRDFGVAAGPGEGDAPGGAGGAGGDPGASAGAGGASGPAAGAFGAAGGGLVFQGADGRPQLVSTEALEATFGAAGASVRLVVLSACYSEAQARALLPHVGCVVGMSGAIRDDAARTFAIGFYGGLGERESIAAAYRQGCAAISLEGLRDRDRPQLAVREGVDASRLVLAAVAPAGADPR